MLLSNFVVVSTMSKELLECWYKRDLHRFKTLLKEENVNMNFLYPEEGYRSILETVASTPCTESNDFAAVLIDGGVTTNLMNYVTGRCAVHEAAESLNWPVLELLMSAHADVNAKDINASASPLHLLARKVSASQDEAHEKCVDILLGQHSLDVNIKNKKGLTPVLLAYQQGAWRMMLKLIRAGAHVENVDYKEDGKRSLREEIRERCPELLDELPDNDSWDPSIVEIPELQSMLHPATQDRFCYFFNTYISDRRAKGNDENLLRQCKVLLEISVQQNFFKPTKAILKFVKTCDAVPDHQIDIFRCGLVAACSAGNLNLLNYIIEETTDLRPNLITDSTILHTLVGLDNSPFSEGQEACFKYLTKALNVNSQDDKGRTPLHLAATNHHTGAVNILLNAKANLFIKDKMGNMPVTDIPVDILKPFLDSNIERENGSNQFYFDFQFLSQSYSGNGEEMTLMNTCKKEALPETVQFKNITEPKILFSHPIFQTFVCYKWRLVRPLFYIKAIFTLGLSASILSYLMYISMHVKHQVETTRIYLKIQLGGFLLLYFLQTFIILSFSQFRKLMTFSSLMRVLYCALGVVVMCISNYPNLYLQLFAAVTALTSSLSLMSVLGEHPKFNVFWYTSKMIFLKLLKLALIYSIILCAFHTALSILTLVGCSYDECHLVNLGIISLPVPLVLSDRGYVVKPNGSHIVTILLIFFTLGSLSHVIFSLSKVHSRIYNDRDYHNVRLLLHDIAQVEEFLHEVRNFKIPKLNNLIKDTCKRLLERISMFSRGTRLRLQPDEGNLLTSFITGKDYSNDWWDRPARLSKKIVRSLNTLESSSLNSQILQSNERRKGAEAREEILNELLQNSKITNDKIKHFSVVLERLEKKSKETEDLLIQCLRISNLRDEEM